MKIGIVGAGALGGLFSGLLTESGEDVWLLDKHRERAELIRRKGLKIEKGKRSRRVRINATTSGKKIGSCDVVIILVKAYDTVKAAKSARPLVGKKTFLLTLQNGIGNAEILNKAFGKRRIVLGATAQGSNIVRDGIISHAGWGRTVIGEQDGDSTDRIKDLKKVFNRAGIETSLTRNIRLTLWQKLITNAAINPLSAITGLRNGELLRHGFLIEIMQQITKESVSVARAKGIGIDYRAAFTKTKAVCERTKDNISSMLQDINRGKKTEIDYISGGIVKIARQLGISVPTNELLWRLVKSMTHRRTQN